MPIHPIFAPVIAAARKAAEQMSDATSAPKHTPGPWEISKSGKLPIHVAAKDGRWKDVPGTIIAAVGNLSVGTGDFLEDIANARIIAAAPDMLALLKELIDIEGPQPGHAEWASKVRALIAKAEAR